MSATLPVLGSVAPDFTAVGSDGTHVALRDLLAKGAVALFFYPGDDTPGCNRQLSAVRDDLTTFRDAGIQPFGVNPASVDRHASYATKFGFGFPLLSDPDREIASAYGALKDDGKGIQRSVFGIARDGTIRFAARGAPLPGDVIAALEA